ncbi:MAG: penicillin-binding protein 1C [Pseudomonadota bacterium]
MNPRSRRVLTWLRWSTVALLSTLLLLDFAFPPQLPRARDTSTLVVARDGTPLRAFADADGVWRYPATPESVSPLYLEALLNYEDRWFWQHPGVNPVALLRAGAQMATSGEVVSGGSTLTMQVARILDAKRTRHTRTPFRKLRQILRALQLEAHLSKREILILYLERAPFGGTIEGVEAASWAYLGKPASRLSHAEAALLAVLPQSPSKRRPDRHPEAAQAARDKVLVRMADLGVWTRAEVDDARIEPVVSRQLQSPMIAALLAQRLRGAQTKTQKSMSERSDPNGNASSTSVSTRIVSTIDANLQRTLEERVSAYFSNLPERTSAALLVVDNETMEARAYVGSLRFGDRERLGHVDMVRAWRSPGSTLKPFLYGMAIDDGLIHSESLLVDAPQNFGDYRPGNFGESFNGPIGAAQALRSSLNVPAVDLLDRIGPQRFAARIGHAGLAMKFPGDSKPNLALILGGTGVRLEDLVGAHAAFNRNGIAGRVRYTPQDPAIDRRVLSPGAAWIVRDILESNPRPGELEQYDRGSRPRVAWKTGTSYGFRDAWAVGGTRRYTVGVWVGRPDGTPLPGQYGALTALPLLFEVVDSLPGNARDAVASKPPPNVARVEICWPLGIAAEGLPSSLCQRRFEAWTLDGAVPPTFAERGARLWSAGRERFEIDLDSGRRITAVCSLPHRTETREIARWPALASPWLGAETRRASTLPPLADDCMPDGRDADEELRIDGLNDGATLAAAPGSAHAVRLSLRALGTEREVQWLLDGRWIGETAGREPLVRDFGEPGEHTLTALSASGAWATLSYRVVARDLAE